MKSVLRIGAVLSVTGACLIGAVSSASACVGVQPRLPDVRAADYIVAGTATSVAVGGVRMIIEVERTIRGSVPSVIHPTGIVVGVCGDGALGLRSGTRVIFARGFPFFSRQIDAYWSFDAKGDLIGSSVVTWNGQTYTYDSVIAALQGLPSTDSGEPGHQVPGSIAAASAFFLALAAAWLVVPRRRRVADPADGNRL